VVKVEKERKKRGHLESQIRKIHEKGGLHCRGKKKRRDASTVKPFWFVFLKKVGRGRKERGLEARAVGGGRKLNGRKGPEILFPRKSRKRGKKKDAR